MILEFLPALLELIFFEGITLLFDFISAFGGYLGLQLSFFGTDLGMFGV